MHGKIMEDVPERTANGIHHITYQVAQFGIIEETRKKKITAQEFSIFWMELVFKNKNT